MIPNVTNTSASIQHKTCTPYLIQNNFHALNCRQYHKSWVIQNVIQHVVMHIIKSWTHARPRFKHRKSCSSLNIFKVISSLLINFWIISGIRMITVHAIYANSLRNTNLGAFFQDQWQCFYVHFVTKCACILCVVIRILNYAQLLVYYSSRGDPKIRVQPPLLLWHSEFQNTSKLLLSMTAFRVDVSRLLYLPHYYNKTKSYRVVRKKL